MKYFLVAILALTLGFFSCNEEKSKTKAAGNNSVLRLKKIGRFATPLYVIQAPGNKKVYVVEQGGKIKVRTNSGWKTFIDLSGRISYGGEQGLLGLAFAPGWKKNHLFYVYYTNKQERQVVAEGKTDRYGYKGKLRRTVLGMRDFASNHNGGNLQFGPGGLYIGTGDGGGGGDPERTASNPWSLLGKILRISPYAKDGKPYSIPADNPYASGGGKKEVFSLGLRNPWRFSIANDKIWIGDVGQESWEEVDVLPLSEARGANFGWSAREGLVAYNSDVSVTNPIDPVLVYNHDAGCSVTGGYLVETASLPALENRYIYGDFCNGWIRSFKLENGAAIDRKGTGLRVPSLTSFGRGNAGQIWVVSGSGPVYRLSED